MTSARKLGKDLSAASDALIAIIEPIEPGRWLHIPGPSVWSIGKDAAHIGEVVVLETA